MTVRVNGPACSWLPTDSCRPTGSVSNVEVTVFGSSRRETVLLGPPSVAVSSRARYDGYSWSGASNDPEATPGKVSISCSWQLFGTSAEQWLRMTVQLSPLAGTDPPPARVAEPVKLISSSTAQVVPAAGVVIVGVGGAPTSIVTVSMSSRPLGSRTRSRAWWLPVCVYVKLAWAEVESSKAP